MAMFRGKKRIGRPVRPRRRRPRRLRYTAARAVDTRRYVAFTVVLVGGVLLFAGFRHLVASLRTFSLIPPFVSVDKQLRSNTTTIPATEIQRYLEEHRIGIFNAARHCAQLKERYPEIADVRCTYVPPATLRFSVESKKAVMYHAGGDRTVFYSETGSSFTARDPGVLMKQGLIEFSPVGNAEPYAAVAAVNYLTSLGLAERLKKIEGSANGELVLLLNNGSRIIADTGISSRKPSAVRTAFDLAASSNTDVYARLLEDGKLIVRDRRPPRGR